MQETKEKQRVFIKKRLVVLAVVVALVAILAGGYFIFIKPKPQPFGQLKTDITIEIVADGKLDKKYVAEVSTYSDNVLGLLKAMTENKYYDIKLEYEAASFGVYITGLFGIKAGENEYWAFYVNGEYANFGISDTDIKTGETYKLELTAW
jgi:hypothetical protein